MLVRVVSHELTRTHTELVIAFINPEAKHNSKALKNFPGRAVEFRPAVRLYSEGRECGPPGVLQEWKDHDALFTGFYFGSGFLSEQETRHQNEPSDRKLRRKKCHSI